MKKEFRNCVSYREKVGCMDSGWCTLHTPRGGFPSACDAEKFGWDCSEFFEKKERRLDGQPQ